MIDPDRLRKAYQAARRDLLAERDASGHWTGQLSSSALSTATAVSALSVVFAESRGNHAERPRLQRLIARGLEYLARQQNPDGGWGDTDKSHSNLSTTMLVRTAFFLAGAADRHARLLESAREYVEREGGVRGLRRRYGKDKTFAVPILTNCALAGLVPWREVSALPFELACLPHAMYRLARLPVVSYAIPALVAIGQARYFHQKPLNPIARLVRRLAVGRSLKVLERMQPASGGFLEATPLTSFVVMSLAGIGRTAHPVVRRGVEFLLRSVRDDGSWPIDTNLATWVTTLATGALAASGERVAWLGCTDWLLSCQHLDWHPFTHAAPGGWGWTDSSGAVPDADDTAGALLALAALRRSARDRDLARIKSAAYAGVRWLLDLQNADGGWPTFCRGWGKLPFDRSGVDLTAHAVRALRRWCALTPDTHSRVDRATEAGMSYLAKQQRHDGRWVPLWFGNQDEPAEENPVYGTARVLLAYRDLGRLDAEAARRGLGWLVEARNPDRGWGGSKPSSLGGEAGGVSSIEETAVAVEALIGAQSDSAAKSAVEDGVARAVADGLDWLVSAVEADRHRHASPIGFYFAKLWYYEKLYPLVFTVSALGRAVRRWCGQAGPLSIPPRCP
jgi:squalene-hopene/tetraprenyl-beta-curcumene cyclase